MNGTYITSLLFIFLSGLGSLYILAEIVLQSIGKSICATEGCKIVAQSARYGDGSMLSLGLALMVILFALSARGLKTVSETREKAVNYILIAALAAEGFLAGYQLFHLHAFCLFCLSVLGIYVVLGFLRVLAGHQDVLAGFGALAAVLALLFLVLPSGGAPLPLKEKYVLFFSPDCKHCAEVREEIERQKLEVRHVDVKEHAATLKSLGIENVPTLMVNGPYEKVFLTGTDAIRRYLSTCRSSGSPAGNAPGLGRGSRAVSSPSGSLPQPGPLNVFPSLGAPGQIFNPPQDEGLCKENTKCE